MLPRQSSQGSLRDAPCDMFWGLGFVGPYKGLGFWVVQTRRYWKHEAVSRAAAWSLFGFRRTKFGKSAKGLEDEHDGHLHR